MSDEAEKPNPAPRPPRRRSRALRWTLRAIVVLAVLLILIFIAGEIVFSTDLPRGIVVRAVEKQLGLKMSAKSISTGWLGHTSLSDVSLSLPLSDKAFVTVPRLEILHSSLPWLALTGNLSIHGIEINQPTVYVAQDSAGRWNFQEVAQLITRAGGSKSADANSSQQTQDIPQLPSVDVHDATIIVVDNKNRTSTIKPVSISGRAEGPLVWRYEAESTDRLKISGRVAPGGPWAHTIDVAVAHVGPWAHPWIDNWPENAALSAQWSGQLINNHIAGWLTISDSRFGQFKLNGPVQVLDNGGATSIRPRGLVIDSDLTMIPRVSANAGEIVLDAATVRSNRLSITAAGGDIVADAKYTFADGSASIRAAWENITLVKSVNQSGDFSMDYSVPFPGQAKVKSELHSHGELPAGQWNATVDVNAQGAWGKPIDWTINAPQARWDGSNHLAADLSGFIATLSTSPAGVALHDLHLGNNNPVAGAGGYDAAKHLWWMALDGRNLPIPRLGGSTLDLNLNVWGNPDRLHVAQLYARSSGLTVVADGNYVFQLPKPVDLQVYINDAENLTEAEKAAAIVRGALTSDYHLVGTLNPFDLDVAGFAHGRNLFLKNRTIGDLDMAMRGSVQGDSSQGPKIIVESEHISLLGGQWNVHGRWPVEHALLRVEVGVNDLPLAQAADRNEISGTLNGDWGVNVTEFSRRGLSIEGAAIVNHFKVSNPQSGASGEVFAADKVTLKRMRVSRGAVSLDPITLEHHVGNIDGLATASVRTTLDDPTQLEIQFDAAAWPYQVKNTKLFATIWTGGKIDLNTRKKSAQGHLDLHADGTLGDQTLGRIDVGADIRDRVIQATSVDVQALGGTARGRGEFDVDHPTQAQAILDWKNIDIARLQNFVPQARDVAGRLAGTFELSPATGPRPLEPAAFRISLRTSNGKARGFSYGNAEIHGFVGPNRIVLADASPSYVEAVGGRVGIWGRVTRHPGDLDQMMLVLTPEKLSLDQIVQAAKPQEKVTPGLISGQLVLVTRLGAPDLSFGSGHLNVSNSDLANVGPIAALYGAMNIGHDPNTPVGQGTIDLRMEGQTLLITAMRYFDRGTEVRAAGTIDKIFSADNSALAITAVGSARPLKSLDLPGLADIDAALSAVQQDAVPVYIFGPVHSFQWKLVPFASIGSSIQELLVGDVKRETGASAE